MPDPIFIAGNEEDDSTQSKIFISHASADAALAKLLRNTLTQAGVPAQYVFYSSARSTGIPTGEDVVGHLRGQLRGAGLVIELISPTFLTRPMCLMELGGAWALGKATFPIVVPPLTRDQAVAAIGMFQMADLSTTSVWDDLRDRVEGALDLRLRSTVWGEAVADFEEAFSKLDKSSPNQQTVGTGRPITSDGPQANTASSDERISLTNVVVRNDQIFGEATNNDSVQHTVSLTATYYSDDGSILGSGGALVVDLRPTATKTFSIYGVPSHRRLKVDVDALL